jgi:hypothetical protein
MTARRTGISSTVYWERGRFSTPVSGYGSSADIIFYLEVIIKRSFGLG